MYTRLSLLSPAASAMADSEGPGSPAAAIELEMVTLTEEPAATRFNRSAPSMRLGRELTLRTRRARRRDGAATDGPFERHGPTYSSLPQRKRRAEGASEPGCLRRASSFQGVSGRGSEPSVEGWTELAVTFGSLRQSSRRLEDRIAVHRHTLRNKPQYTRRNVWGHFKHVRWPKLKSRLRVVLGYELWKGHLKEVEGNFGTGVVSYFIFLRWLFLMNLLIFLLWFGLVVIPQLIWVGHTGASRTPSQLSCVFNFSLDRECPDGPPPSNLAAAGRRLVCARSVTPSQFDVGLCQFEKENESLIARTEHPSRTVSVSECNATSTDVTQYYYLCPVGIDPVTPWYQYIFEFVLGKGLFNDTVLFYGRYTNETVQTVGGARYSVPLAYLIVTGIIFAISVLLLVYKMGQAFNESYLAFTSKQTLNYCNKVFSSWDFTITDQTAARLKKAQIRREFEEDVADLEKRSQKRDVKEWVLVLLSRVLANVFVFVILAAAGTAIYYAAVLGLNNELSGDTSSLQLQGLLLPVVITAFNIFLPILFSFLARFERFKTQSGEIRMTLIRAIIVRLSSLIVLILTLFIVISCTQSFNGRKTEEEEEEDNGVCQFSVPDVETLVFDENSTETVQRENCPQCWETFVGQEFYKLGLINFVLTSLTTLVTESSRNWLTRLLSCTKFVFLQEKVGKGEFNIAKSILDLIYTQALLWLGFFYSPFLPFVILITSFVLFYVKKYSLIWNLVPSKRGAFKASKTNFLFLFLMMAVLLTSLIPIGYAIARLHPSQGCGPFRGKEIIYDVITNVLEQAGCRAQQYLDYFQSTGFLVPVIMVLLLLCYAQWVVLRARKKNFNLLKQQLILESADATFYGQQLQRRMRVHGGVRTHDLQDEPVVDVPSLEQRLEARQSLMEEEREEERRMRRISGQVP